MDDRIINFLLEKIDPFEIDIRPENKEEAIFVCAQAVRSIMLMTFLNRKTEEREAVINELLDILSVYLEKK